jgi:hypothetical protein
LFVKRLVLMATSAVVACTSLVVITGGTSGADGMSTGTGGAAAVTLGTRIPTGLPPHLRAIRGVSNDASTNWSGYAQVATAPGTFTGVSDTFVVPTVATDIPGRQFVADWVGIGGYDESTLVQTGIQAEVLTRKGHRVVVYDAWTEHLPQAEKTIKYLPIYAGNTVTATVQETAPNKWSMEVVDVTTGDSGGLTNVSYDSSGESAEAINERPCLRAPCASRDLAHLAQTPDITFAPGFFSVTPVGQTPVEQPLLAPANDPNTVISLVDIVMTNNTDSADIATPSGPDTADDGFDVADGANPPAPPTI